MINPKDTDEIWLALEQSAGGLRREGHTSVQGYDKLDCWGCYSLHLLERAMEVYLNRTPVAATQTTIVAQEAVVSSFCAHEWSGGYTCIKCGQPRRGNLA